MLPIVLLLCRLYITTLLIFPHLNTMVFNLLIFFSRGHFVVVRYRGLREDHIYCHYHPVAKHFFLASLIKSRIFSKRSQEPSSKKQSNNPYVAFSFSNYNISARSGIVQYRWVWTTPQ
jgi:hypothetical protein